MIRIDGKDPFYVKALGEHLELRRLLRGIENKLNAGLGSGKDGGPAWRELQQSLNGLIAHLEAHFAEEEAGGLLEEAASRLPRLGPQCMAIERQHKPLLRQLCEIILHARNCGQSGQMWQIISREFRAFAQALLTHEAAENRIAEEAFDGAISNGL